MKRSYKYGENYCSLHHPDYRVSVSRTSACQLQGAALSLIRILMFVLVGITLMLMAYNWPQ